MKKKIVLRLKSTSSSIERSGGKATVHHHQTIKQSVGYQSVEVSYGMSLETNNTKADIENAVKRVESVVEGALSEKFTEQNALVNQIAAKNRS